MKYQIQHTDDPSSMAVSVAEVFADTEKAAVRAFKAVNPDRLVLRVSAVEPAEERA